MSTSASTIPGWLLTPPLAEIEPPVTSRVQVLPVEQLSWENFERLCLRLARLEGEVEHWQLYGVRGQGQDGIDIYARRTGGAGYVAYQCKRIVSLSPGELRKGVDKFIGGEWCAKAQRFVFCTSLSAVRTELADEIEKQAERLRSLDPAISFDVWDAESLSERLKAHPLLVDDFFSREWVRRFCGEEAAASLAGRLDGRNVTAFRERLGRFYDSLFEQQDPLARRLADGELRVTDFFVHPTLTYYASSRSDLPSEVQPADARAPGMRDSAVGARSESPQEAVASAPVRSQISEELTRWLRNKPRVILQGGPGCGKSTILRYIATEILSDSPSDAAAQALDLERLPVWVSFAFWTKLLEARGPEGCGLLECVHAWLQLWGQDDLWPLVTAALRDNRLLLLIDGLDEWASEASARLAVRQLVVFTETHGAHAIVTGRLEGVRRVPVQGRGWETADVAPLSDSQIDAVCERWYLKRRVGPEGARASVAQFDAELRQRPELREIGRVPLMLVLLLLLRAQQVVLPRRRFDVYAQLLDLLILQHPEINHVAASLGSSEPSVLDERESKHMLAQIAYVVHTQCPDGVVTAAMIENAASAFLQDDTYGLGMSAREAARMAASFTDIAARKLGLLVRVGVSDFSFFHRSLQEHLVAVHVGRRPVEEQQAIVREKCADPRWREAVLGLVWQVQRPEDLKALVGAIQEEAEKPQAGRFGARELLAEVAVGEFRCPASLRRSLLERTYDAVAVDSWMPHRQRLLSLVIDGLKTPALRDWVAERFRNGCISRGWGHEQGIRELARWPADELTLTTCKRALFSDDVTVQKATAATLGTLSAQSSPALEILREVATGAHDHVARASALRGLALSASPGLSESLAAALRDSSSGELRCACALSRIRLRKHDRSDLSTLLDLARMTRSSYWWRSDVALALCDGWAGDAELKESMLRDVHGRREYEFGIAQFVLLNGYANDPEVLAYCVAQLTEEHPFLADDRSAFASLASLWTPSPTLVAALEQWADKQDEHSIHMINLAEVARFVHTPPIKRALIRSVRQKFAPQWAARALLEHWGQGDPEVASTLRQQVNDTPYELAHLIPQIFPLEAEAKEYLRELLRRADEKSRIGRVVAALAQLGVSTDDPVVMSCLEASRGCGTAFFVREEAESELIEHFASAPSVRALCLDRLRGRNPPYAAAARSYAADNEMRQVVAALLIPLPKALRLHALEQVRKGGFPSGVRAELLAGYDQERDSEAKALASWCFHVSLPEDQHEGAAAKLGSDLAVVGPDMEERREAAFTGLVALSKLDRLIELASGSGAQKYELRGSRAARNGVMLRSVAERWGVLKPAERDAIRRVVGLPDEEFWGALCETGVVAVECVLSALDENPGIAKSSSVLKFLGPRWDDRDRVLQFCLEGLARSHSSGTWADVFDEHEAAMLVASLFGGRADVRGRLVDSRDASPWRPGEVAALALGWGADAALEKLQQALTGQSVDALTYVSLRYALSPADDLIKTLAQDSEAWEGRRGLRVVADHMVARLSRDERAAAAVASYLTTAAGPNGRATLPQLLAAAGALTPEVEEWARAEADRQLAMACPELGLDLLNGEMRSVANCLLDVLTRG